MSETEDAAEALAKERYLIMNLVRVAAIITLIAGLAIARDVIPAPWVLGAAMAVGGMVSFFFGPPLLARRWKAQDRGEE